MVKILQKLSSWDKKTTKKIVAFSSKRIKFIEFLALSGNAQPWIFASLLFFIFELFMGRSLNLLQITMIGVNAMFSGLVKISIKRIRPKNDLSGKFLTPLDEYSFPSGHTGRAMCFAMMMTLFYPKIGWLFILWGLGVGFSRIALEIHYLLDIFGGIVLGSIIGMSGYFLFDLFDSLITPLIEWIPSVF